MTNSSRLPVMVLGVYTFVAVIVTLVQIQLQTVYISWIAILYTPIILAAFLYSRQIYGAMLLILLLLSGWIALSDLPIAMLRPERLAFIFLFYTIFVEVTNYISRRQRNLLAQYKHELEERRKVTEQLRGQQAFIRKVLDTSPVAIFVKDLTGKYVLTNQFFADLYETNHEDMIGKTDADFVSNPASARTYHQNDLSVLKSKSEYSITTKRVIDDIGTSRWMETIKRPLLSSDDEVEHILCIGINVTRLKLAEEELVRNAAMARAAAEASHLLLAASNFDEAVIRSIRSICEAASLDRVYIFKNHIHTATREPMMSRACRICATTPNLAVGMPCFLQERW